MKQHKKQTLKKERKTVYRESKETVAVFIDYSNLFIGLRNQDKEVDLIELTSYLTEGRESMTTYIYFGISQDDPQSKRDLIERLSEAGFCVRQKTAKVLPDGRFKCDMDIEMTLDVLDFVKKHKPNIVVLVTGDSDFIPLVNKLILQGIRVEIASFPGVVSHGLKESASGYINLFLAKVND